MVDPDLLARTKSVVGGGVHRGADRVRVRRIEHPESRVPRGDADDLPQHLRGKARSPHAEQHHIREAGVPNRTRERLQAS